MKRINNYSNQIDKCFEEELRYLLKFLDYYTEQTVYKVLNDSETDPKYSAVTTVNLLKCYRDVKIKLDGECYYNDLRGYFQKMLLSSDDYLNFETKRIKEEAYYIGKIYYQSTEKGVVWE